MFFTQHTQRFFLVCTLLLNSGALMASEPIESIQDDKLVVLQKWLKDTAGQDYTIDQLKTLEKLDLENKIFAEVPPEIGELKNLTELYLVENALRKLPPEIGNLINLKVLSVEYNEITELPPQIGNLINLETLVLGGDILDALPSTIGKLKNLKSLNLRGNNIMALPPEFANLEKLETLRLNRLLTGGLQYLLPLINKKLTTLLLCHGRYEGKAAIEKYINSFQFRGVKGAGM